MARRLVIGTVFGSIVACLLVGLHYYLAKRLALDLGLRPDLETSIVLAITIAGLSIPLVPLGEHFVRPPLSRLLTVPGSLWMGVAFVLIVLLAASELLLPVIGDGSVTPAQWRALAVLAVGVPVIGVALFAGLRFPAVREVTVHLQRWPATLDGLRIVQLSDLHIGPIRGRRFVRRLTTRVNGLTPDLIAITGDLVDGRVAAIGPEVAPFADLRAPLGSWFVTGNHDMYSGPDGWMARVRELGVRVLANECVRLDYNGAAFTLAGVHDHQGRIMGPRFAEDVPRALEAADPDLPVLLLAHDPSTFRVARAHPVDLQLSGHTHDGQLWPFRYLVRLVIPWIAGLYQDSGSQLYVSRGTGSWGPPMRLFAPTEITLLTLRRAE